MRYERYLANINSTFMHTDRQYWLTDWWEEIITYVCEGNKRNLLPVSELCPTVSRDFSDWLTSALTAYPICVSTAHRLLVFDMRATISAAGRCTHECKPKKVEACKLLPVHSLIPSKPRREARYLEIPTIIIVCHSKCRAIGMLLNRGRPRVACGSRDRRMTSRILKKRTFHLAGTL